MSVRTWSAVCILVGGSFGAAAGPSEVEARLLVVKSLVTSGPDADAKLVEYLREDNSPHVRAEAARALARRAVTKLALAALTDTVADPDEPPGVRGTAAFALGKLGAGSARVKAALVRLAGEADQTQSALKALIDLGATTEAKAFLAHADPQVRRMATLALANTAGGDTFLAGLTSPDPEVVETTLKRAANRGLAANLWTKDEIAAVQKLATDPKRTGLAVTALVQIRQTAAIAPFLAECLSSSDDLVRTAGVRGLEVAGPAVVPVLPKIVAALDTLPAHLKPRAVRAIGEAGADAKPYLPKLYECLASPDAAIRAAGVAALLKAGAADPKAATAKVKALAADTDLTVRKLVETFLAEVPADPSEFAAQLANKDWRVGVRALPAVTRLGADAAPLAPDLLALAGRIPVPEKIPGKGIPLDPTPHQIAVALAEIGPAAVPALARGLSDRDARVRFVAAGALAHARLDAAPAIAELRTALADADRGVRQHAGRALGNLGYRARAAVPDLITGLTKHPDSGSDAAVALALIGATGDDATKLIDLARAAAADATAVGRHDRIVALGGAGPAAAALLADAEKALPANDRLVYAVRFAKEWCDRDLALKTHLAAVADLKTAKSPHDTVGNVLHFELSADQKRAVAGAVAGVLADVPPATQAELLRCLGWLGPDAAAALPAVEKLDASPDARVRGLARRTAALLKP